MSFQNIEKENISGLHFPSRDVLSKKEDKLARTKKLEYAMKLGNLEKRKCKIAFEAEEGEKLVETTIWSVTDKYIILKGNVLILITSIFDIII